MVFTRNQGVIAYYYSAVQKFKTIIIKLIYCTRKSFIINWKNALMTYQAATFTSRCCCFNL